MLFNQAPLTSLEEDLREFKLLQEEAPSTKAPQVKEPDNKGGDYAGPPQGKDEPKEAGYAVDVNDSAAGWRANVVVRGDTNSAGTAKAEDTDEDGETVEEAKKLPAFLKAKLHKQEQEEVESAIAEAEAAREALVSRAMDVIESYYSSDEPMGEDEYRGVIDAFAVLADAYDAALESVTARLESVMEAEDEDEDEDEDKAPKSKADKDEDEDEDEDEGSKMESLTPALGRARRLLSESRGGDLGNLVADLRSLEESLTGSSAEAEAIERHASLIEGYESLRDSCSAICDSILNVIRTQAGVEEGEELELDGEDERVRLGAFFESIIEDCENHLAAMAEGELDDDVAQEDLGRMKSDVQRGIEAMKSVEA